MDDARSDDVRPAPGGWQVVVEHSQRGWRRPVTQVHLFPQLYDTPAEALAAAQVRAFEFAPPGPDRGRRVYADADGFLTLMVTGATVGNFHFNTRVVQVVAPPEPVS